MRVEPEINQMEATLDVVVFYNITKSADDKFGSNKFHVCKIVVEEKQKEPLKWSIKSDGTKYAPNVCLSGAGWRNGRGSENM